MRIDIIVVYVARYQAGHEMNFVPPITGIHLAALTPPQHEVRVIHQQLGGVNFETNADLIALSFFTGFAMEAYRLADEFRRRGRTVIAGGPHVTFEAEESLLHFSAIVQGEAESVWSSVIEDAEGGRLQRIYRGRATDLKDLPTPRYELLPRSFFIPRVIQATRGCPFSCAFCSVPALNPGYRMRPVADVIRDIRYNGFRHWWQKKVVWFWDDNLTVSRPWIKQLLREMIPLRKWWLTQASMDIASDPELLDLMRDSGCIGVFFGIESFGADSLASANKPQNKVAKYAECIRALHDRGICVMAGFISGFDGDSPATIRQMADRLLEIGVDVPFLSVLTPYPGTAAYANFKQQGRILPQRSWNHYNGYNVAYVPSGMEPAELIAAHRALWRRAFSPAHSLRRVMRSMCYLRTGAWLMCACMNLFYCVKRLRGNLPRTFEA